MNWGKVRNFCFITIGIFTCQSLWGQEPARVSEQRVSMPTYPFSDPDPIASPQKLYPYFRFDGFSTKPIMKEWKAVILENDYIRVQIMPEIGGKIWSAYDKVAGKDFLYNNGVVKFRDIAMRGPWTSGGIEANYGIIGHTPNTSTPVDYFFRKNDDGSASCFIHTLDLLTRSQWTLEVRLEKDKGYFSTRSFWNNGSAVEQPYYSWMNLAVPAAKDLQFLYPGHSYIGHGGEHHPWPIDEKGRDLSYYQENAFAGSKSYHVLGAPSNTFGAYWNDSDFGMARYANREDKLGKKIFLWAQSDAGKIWEDLLTDSSGQYVEIQSGRLFNQNVTTSSASPFKQQGFAPYVTDRWEEQWMAFQGIGKPTAINNLAAIRLQQADKKIVLWMNAKQTLRDSVSLLDTSAEIIGKQFAKTATGSILQLTFNNPASKQARYLLIRGTMLDLSLNTQSLGRPMVQAKKSMSIADSLALLGRDLLRFRLFDQAEPTLKEAYRLTPDNISICNALAKLHWFKMEYDSVFHYSRQSLSIDTYDGEANYYYALAATKLNRRYDAIDGLQVASTQAEWRAAAYTALSALYFSEHDISRSMKYAEDALRYGTENVTALQLMYLSAKALQSPPLYNQSQATLRRLDPFNSLMLFEEYWGKKDEPSKQKFLNSVKQELKIEPFIELACWYSNIHAYDKAAAVLTIAPQNTESLLWLAWLNRNTENATFWMNKALASDPAFVFPFREETYQVLLWARQHSKSWKIRYLQALILKFRNRQNQALTLLSEAGSENVNFAPYYVVRSQLRDKTHLQDALADMRKAATLDKQQWRYGKFLCTLLLQDKRPQEARNTARQYVKRNPENYILGMSYVRSLLACNEFVEAEKVLATLHILPFEGASEGHKYYEQTKLMLAYDALLRKNTSLSVRKINESRLWPKQLGVGEPFDSEKDEILSYWLEAELYKNNNPDKTKALLEQISASDEMTTPVSVLIKAAALHSLGREDASRRLLQEQRSRLKSLPHDELLTKIKEGDLRSYWTDLVKAAYQREDERLF